MAERFHRDTPLQYVPILSYWPCAILHFVLSYCWTDLISFKAVWESVCLYSSSFAGEVCTNFHFQFKICKNQKGYSFIFFKYVPVHNVPARLSDLSCRSTLDVSSTGGSRTTLILFKPFVPSQLSWVRARVNFWNILCGNTKWGHHLRGSVKSHIY